MDLAGDPYKRTCTKSIGDVSPDNRLADILLAGNPLGTIFTEQRLRGFVATREDMLTATRSAWVSLGNGNAKYVARQAQQLGPKLTSVLVSKI